MTVDLAKVTVGSTDYLKANFSADATKTALSPYAGTYTFNLTCDAQGIFADDGTITNSATLGGVYNTSTQSASFTVVISGAGVISGTFSTLSKELVVEGQDGNAYKDHSEGTTLDVEFSSVAYA